MPDGPSRSWHDRLWEELVPRFGIDLRALAAFRIALAGLVLADLLFYRAPDLAAFYTDGGVLPARVLDAVYPVASTVSLHTLAGSLLGQSLLLAAFALAAFALLVGYRTRWAALATWMLMASMHARNPHVLNAGDTLALATLFFGLFLPLGQRWSVDAARGTRAAEARDGLVVNAATVGLLLQVVVVYATNAVFKTRSPRWMDGTAVRYIFALDDFTVGLGDLLAQLDPLLVAVNWTWFLALAASPLLVLLTGWARAAYAALLAGLHLGMHVTMMLGLFPLVSIAALLVVLPPEVWDRLEVRLREPARRLAARLHRPSPTTRRRLPARWRRRASLGVNALLGLAIVFGLAWHGVALGWLEEPQAAEQLGRAGEHQWRMFSPPSESYGWVQAPANLSSGERVDAIQLASFERTAPEDLADAYPSTLWHRYLKDLPELTEPEQEALAAYLCQRVHQAYGEPVDDVALVYVEHEVRLDAPDPVERRTVHHRVCGG